MSPSVDPAQGNQKLIPTYKAFMPVHAGRRVVASSVDEIRQAVMEAAAAGLCVRPMGAGESWAPYLLTTDVSVVTTKLNRIHKVDREAKTITTDAGVNLGDITRALGKRGLSLPSLPFMPDATIAGIISTSTHGSSHKWGTVADSVRSMDMVLPSGEVKHLGPHSPRDELRAARTSVGMLGVITKVELQVIDMPWVRHERLAISLTAFMERLPAIKARFTHMWVHWELGTENLQIDCLEARETYAPGFYPYVDDRERRWHQLPVLARMLPPPVLRAARGVVHAARAAGKVASKALSPSPETHGRISMQYGVPMTELGRVISAIKASNVPGCFPGMDMEIKFLKGTDQTYLGFNAGGDTALFNVYWRVPLQETYDVLDPLENLMRSMGARPHWGKFHNAPTVDYLERVYPKWADFERVRNRFDPHGVFSMSSAPNTACPEGNAMDNHTRKRAAGRYGVRQAKFGAGPGKYPVPTVAPAPAEGMSSGKV